MRRGFFGLTGALAGTASSTFCFCSGGSDWPWRSVKPSAPTNSKLRLIMSGSTLKHTPVRAARTPGVGPLPADSVRLIGSADGGFQTVPAPEHLQLGELPAHAGRR